MEATGVSVKLAALRYQGEWGFKVSEKRYAGFGGICFYDVPFPCWVMGMLKIIRQEKINVIHAHTYGAANRSWLAAQLLGVPLVYEIHSLLGEELERDKLGRGWKFQLNHWLERIVLRNADHVVVLGQAVKQVLMDEQGIPASKISVIYPGVDLAEFAPSSNRVRNHKKLFPGRFVVMYVGQLGYPTQGVNLLLETIPLVTQRHPEVLFAFVGGPAGVAAEMQLGLGEFQSKAIFLTDVDSAKLPEIIAQADILVHPRLDCRDNYSVQSKIGIYLASGKPIVATSVADYNFLLGELHAGILVKPEKYSLADGICKILSNQISKEKLINNAIEVASRFFDINKSIDNYLSIFNKLICGKILNIA
jgi:glycosyltransferase involved in cell wall biosynthesis